MGTSTETRSLVMNLGDRPCLASFGCPNTVLIIDVDRDFPVDVENTTAMATRDNDGVIWVVLSDVPGRTWDFSEEGFRAMLGRRNQRATIEAQDS